MIRRTLLLTALILIVATLAQAQTRGRPMARAGHWEFTVQTRYFSQKNFEGQGESSLKINDDLGWGFGFGYNINQNFNLGMSFNWRNAGYSATGVDAEDPDTIHTYNGEMSVTNIGVTGEWNILKGSFTPYVNGSLAFSTINSNIFAGYTSGCWWDYWWGPVCGSIPMTYGTNTSASTLGAGVRLEITEAFFARAGYEHGWTGVSAFSDFSMLRVDVGWVF